MTRAPALALLALLALAGASPAASAHQALPDPLTGTLAIPAGGSVRLAVADLHAGDTLWIETTALGGASSVTALVRWSDAAGATHEGPRSVVSQATELTFRAPREFEAATLELANSGDAEASVTYAYLSTAPFWRSYDLWVPTFAPFLFLGLCALLAVVLRPWIRARGTGPVRPPGWEETQARKALEKGATSRPNESHHTKKTLETDLQ